MKILLVSQFFVPYQTPRAFRTYELARELAKDNDVTVLSLLGDYDYSNMCVKDGFNVISLGKSHLGNVDSIGNCKFTFFNRGMGKLFKNILQYPSIELFFMTFSRLKKINDFDVIISIAHPHTIHWGVAFRKLFSKKFPLWISDCGDPFMGNPYFTPPFYYKYIERFWCKQTDFITIPIENARAAYYSEFHDKIKVIPQGFRMSNSEYGEYKVNKVPTFIYAGNVYENKRDPSKFLNYLSQLKMNFRFIVFTQSLDYFKKYKNLLGSKIEINDFIERDKLIYQLSKSDFLINIRNVGSVQAPSKLIDYFISKRPVLTITSDFDEKNIFEEFLVGNYEHKDEFGDMSKYDIENVGRKFRSLFFENKKQEQ